MKCTYINGRKLPITKKMMMAVIIIHTNTDDKTAFNVK